MALYDGTQEPLGLDNNLTHDAGVLVHILQLSDISLEDQIPALRDNLIYTDAVKNTFSSIAQMIRRRGLYTLTALEAATGNRLFPKDTRKAALDILHNPARIKDGRYVWAIQTIETALNEIAELPAQKPEPVTAIGPRPSS